MTLAAIPDTWDELIEGLPRDDRHLLTCIYVHNASIKRMARQIQTSEAELARRLNEILNRLRRELE